MKSQFEKQINDSKHFSFKDEKKTNLPTTLINMQTKQPMTKEELIREYGEEYANVLIKHYYG